MFSFPVRILVCALLALGAIPLLAQGGPPYYTNDPGIPGNRNWEINFGGVRAGSSPPGLEALASLYPALKRGAKVDRPCGTENCQGLFHRVVRDAFSRTH